MRPFLCRICHHASSYDPLQRISAVDALRHEFFSLQLDMPPAEEPTPEASSSEDDGTVAAAEAERWLITQQPNKPHNPITPSIKDLCRDPVVAGAAEALEALAALVEALLQ